ncbi:MAG: homocitrate synthase/isopropylmalate synthase family protein [Candidatus Aminicenantaceae bacterium]
MVKILDSTLREGEQTPGVYFDLHIKAAIAEMLSETGIDIIEAGHPVVTSEIYQSVRNISGLGFSALIGAHSRSLKKDVDMALNCKVDFLGIFYCVSDERFLQHSSNLSIAVDKITSTISYARERNPDLVIRYTPEDTVRSNWKNVVDASSAAVQAGANIISIADTTGYLIPGSNRSMYHYVDRLKDDLAKKNLFPQIAIHCHNDRGLALANALDGFRAGADIIDATVLGLGERAGLLDLATLLSVLHEDFNLNTKWKLKKIPELYKLVSNYAGIDIPVNFPITGKNAFTHCAGIHTQAALKNPVHYQSIDPDIVGRKLNISLDHMSGLSSLMYCLEQIGENSISRNRAETILTKVKEIGQSGRVVDLTELKYIVKFLKKSSINYEEQK